MSRLSWRLGALAGVLAVGGCDNLTPPAATNPYDPAFEGQRSITAPSGLRRTSSTPTAISLAWADNSSFETSVRVERTRGYLSSSSVFETVAVLPPDATQYTDDALRDDTPVSYRVVAVASGTAAATPTASYIYPLGRRSFESYVPAGSLSVFSPDGGTFYGPSAPYSASQSAEVFVADTQTGQIRARIGGVSGVAGFLADGRVALYTFGASGRIDVSFLRGTTVEQRVALPAASCGSWAEAPVVVSADGSRAAAVCRSPEALVWWSVGGGGPSSYPLTSGAAVAALSPDGRVAYAGSGSLLAVDLGAGRPLWFAPVAPARAVLSPDGRALLAARHTGGLVLLDAATGAVRAEAPTGALPAAFSADGQTVAFNRPSYTGSYYGAVQIARASDLSPTLAFTAPETIWAFRPTASSFLAVGNTVYRYDLAQGWTEAPTRP